MPIGILLKACTFRPLYRTLITDDSTMFSRKAFPDPIQFATSRLKTENVEQYPSVDA
jgi:hypothetical protein